MRRYLWCGLGLAFAAGLVSGQGLTEFGAAAAGSTVGAASGKVVSDGITKIFGKVNGTVDKAAGDKTQDGKTPAKKGGWAAPAMSVGPGVAKASSAPAVEPDTSGVPAPPPSPADRIPVHKMPIVTQAVVMPVEAPAPPPPPPPSMTPDDLKQVSPGMARADVLKLGVPASRITSFEDGHLSEVYSYRQNGERFGVVRLEDGSVASVQGQ